MKTTTEEMVTFGEGAYRIGGGVTWRHLARLAERGAIPFTKVSHIRLVRVADLPTVRVACEQAGYLRPEVEAGHAS